MFKIKSISGRIPEYETPGSSGMDLRAFLKEDAIIEPGEIKLIPTGISIDIPIGYEAQIRARSGLALKYGITMANGIGTIDSDYRGEIGIILVNLGKNRYVIKDNDRIAQMVICKYEQVQWTTEDLSKTQRGEGGFGHTGI